MPEPLDPPQARFDVQQGGGHPPLPLIGPVVDLVGAGRDQGVERLDAVGGLQTDSQFAEQAEAVTISQLFPNAFPSSTRATKSYPERSRSESSCNLRADTAMNRRDTEEGAIPSAYTTAP
jgi:hypothetical protein